MPIKRYACDYQPISDTDFATLERLGSALICDAMGGRQTMDAGIKPISPGTRLLGQARTVLSRGDNSAAVAALRLNRPGEVMVIDAGADTTNATWGGVMTAQAIKRGLAGVVIDGSARDVGEIRDAGFPLFCRAAIPRGPGEPADRSIDAPIMAGGISVRPGDIVYGDDDGVVVIPLDWLEATLEAAAAKVETEKGWLERIESGGALADVLDLPDPEIQE